MRKPLEFFSSILTIILNNSFYLYGIYVLALLSIGDDSSATKEYLISTGMVLIGWGLLNVFGGGLYNLASLIETGEMESYLARPRPPLFLIAISKFNLTSFGDIIQGFATIILIISLYGFPLGLLTLASSLILMFAFAAVVILVGSTSFFSSRGSQLSYVILNVVLTLSLFPVGRALQGREKWILYFTPLLMTATLPRLTALSGESVIFITFIASVAFIGLIAILLFNLGLKFYKTKNYVILNE